ncbi:MAG: DUF2189 domain-containing protein [Euryhalocaulis sp.]|uniref:DUF2189 domain-containing protein n=1 Tax=Euryhalocaulis sp. TaxID=2744307 RepID=UPI0017C735B2|nr:DUF2189 domain-containing protein [Euryhalocaulis sp.]MBA4800833.1 DUF2189 domain-containing protein [Euryhalocaulis sp.]
MAEIVLHNVRREAPWEWLALGWRDLVQAPVLSLSLGAVFVLIGLALSAGLFAAGYSAAIPAAISGFAVVAPLFAIGFYQISRTLDAGRKPGLKDLFSLHADTVSQIGFLGVLLIILLLVWARLAQFIYAYFTNGVYLPLDDFTAFVLTDSAGLALLIVGGLTGGVLAIAAFAISALSFPMLVDKDTDAVTALTASVNAVRRQPFVMLTWAAIIAVMTLAGGALFIAGLMVVFPWLGHASWRAYRSFIEES